jgi:hypothetical protein
LTSDVHRRLALAKKRRRWRFFLAVSPLFGSLVFNRPVEDGSANTHQDSQDSQRQCSPSTCLMLATGCGIGPDRQFPLPQFPAILFLLHTALSSLGCSRSSRTPVLNDTEAARKVASVDLPSLVWVPLEHTWGAEPFTAVETTWVWYLLVS